MKRQISVVLSVMVGLVLLAIGAPPSTALQSQWRLGHGIGTDSLWVGQQKNEDGTVVYCADQPLSAPGSAVGYLDPVSGGFVRDDGSRLTTVENAQLSYIVHTWGKTDDDGQAAAVQLAVWAMSNSDGTWGSQKMNTILSRAHIPRDVSLKAQEFGRAAQHQAGPYQLSLSLKPLDENSFSASLQLRGGSGDDILGATLSLSVSGSLQLPQDVPKMTGTGATSFVVRRASAAEGELHATATGLAAPAARWLAPNSPGFQRLFLLSEGQSTEASASVSSKPPLTAQIRTESTPRTLDAAGAVRDVLHFALPPATKWPVDARTGAALVVTAKNTLWGPFSSKPQPSKTIPANARVAGNATTTITGAGTFTSTPIQISEPGYYVWTGAFEAAPPELASTPLNGWRSGFAEPGEVSLLKYAPHFTTQVSAKDVQLGETVEDRFVGVTGVPPNAQPAVTLTLFGPLPAPPTQSAVAPSSAPLVGSVRAKLSEGAVVALPQVTRAGCYTVVATLAETELLVAFSSDFGIPEETFCVRAPAPPTSTEGSPQLVPESTTPTALANTGAESTAFLLASGLSMAGLGVGLKLLPKGRRRGSTDVAPVRLIRRRTRNANEPQ